MGMPFNCSLGMDGRLQVALENGQQCTFSSVETKDLFQMLATPGQPVGRLSLLAGKSRIWLEPSEHRKLKDFVSQARQALGVMCGTGCSDERTVGQRG